MRLVEETIDENEARRLQTEPAWLLSMSSSGPSGEGIGPSPPLL